MTFRCNEPITLECRARSKLEKGLTFTWKLKKKGEFVWCLMSYFTP